MRDYDYKKKLQRVPNGIIFGVAEGLARYLSMPVWVVRALWILAFIITGWILAFIITGFFPTAIVYLLLAIALPVGPA